ncbi:MAG: hypothetical protein AAF607_10150 [Pseudomonadota bacterium]
MTTSGSIDFDLSAALIVQEALEMCGIGQEGEDITADMEARGLRSLNLILKAWQADPRLWLKTEGTETMVQGQSAYTLTPRPLRILSVRRQIGDAEVPMSEMSRDDYFSLPNKTSQGLPVQWYYDPQQSTGVLYVWQNPNATAMTLNYTYVRSIEDIDSNANTADVPAEWLEALTLSLAAKLAMKQVSDLQRRLELKQDAAIAVENVRKLDRDTASVFLQPCA